MVTTKHYNFNLFFNYDIDGNRNRAWAEKMREDAIVYLIRLFENKAQFSCIAKDESKTGNCLLLRGYMNLNSPCLQAYAKKLLGKYSSCKASYFGDMVNLCRLVHVDRDLIVAGRLPRMGNNSSKKVKPFVTDPKFVVKILLDSIDKHDLIQHKDSGVCNVKELVKG